MGGLATPSVHNMQVRASDRFWRDYLRASPALVQQVRNKLDFVTRVQAATQSLSRHLETVEGIRSPSGLKFLEIDVAGALRLIATQTGDDLVLLRFGPKRVVPSFARNYNDAATVREVASATAFHEVLAGPPDDEFVRLDEEMSPTWAWFLDDHQAAVADDIVESIEDCLLGDAAVPPVHFVMGAAGTGKTCLMLNLWMRLSGAFAGSAETWTVDLQVRPRVLGLLGRQGSVPSGPSNGPADVVLIDDPDDSSQAVDGLAAARATGRPIVVAIDPLQIAGDSALLRRIDADDCEVHWLETCYRQKTRVARRAAELSESSLRRRHSRRSSSDLSAIQRRALKVKFSNPSGLLSYGRVAGLHDLRPASGEIAQVSGLMRRVLGSGNPQGVFAVLVVMDDIVNADRTGEWQGAHRFIEEALTSANVRADVEYLPLSQSEDVRGLEYSMVVLFVKTPIAYSARPLRRDDSAHIRTVVTRARDALCLVNVGRGVPAGSRDRHRGPDYGPWRGPDHGPWS